VDVSNFKTSDWLKIGGGAVFLVAGFLTWWKAEIEGLSDSANAFEWFLQGTLPWLIFIAIAVVTALIALGKLSIPATTPVAPIILGAAAIATLLFLIRFFSAGFDGQDEFEELGGELSRGIGLWLALIGAVLVLAGAVIAFTETRSSTTNSSLR
jgi:hypothetical protein